MCRLFNLMVPILCFCRYNFEMYSSVPLLTPFTSYSEWKMKMIASLKKQDLYEVSIGLGEESFERKDDCLNECDALFGTIALALSPSLCYLTKYVEYPKDLWTKLGRTFGKIDEDHNITLESTSSTKSILDLKISSSTLSDEAVQDEEEAKASTQSIRIEDNLLAVNFSLNALEVYEISDISSPHMAEI